MPWKHRNRQDTSEVIADETYYLDGEGNVTTDSTVAVRQIAAKGSPISKENQEKYGIPAAKGKGSKAEAAEAVEEEVDGGKKASRPSANKAAKPKSNKGAK